jgi:hypothetical protein
VASLILGAAGAAIGGAIGGSVLGMSAATIGGAIGTAAGSMVDSWLLATTQAQNQRIVGSRMESLTITSSTEGMVIPRLHGRMRIGGNVIWATDFRERIVKKRDRVGGKGGGGGGTVTTKEFLYYASFAVALCEGPITGIGRIWADGEIMALSGVTWRWYPGDEVQEPDPLIVSKSGADAAPGYRGVAYVVFEDLALESYGNRLPQLSFEVFRALEDEASAEAMLKSVVLIPGAGEFAYATTPVKVTVAGETSVANVNASSEQADIDEALDRLLAGVPGLESVTLVAAWFGDDLRCGETEIKPGVEVASKSTTPLTWVVDGVSRGSARLVSTVDGGPAFGGTPSDASIVQAIATIRARGLRVGFIPFLLMDIAAGNTLPDPYSDNAAGVGQRVYPWRGRITCSPAAGYVGTVDKTGTAATQVAAFFGAADAADFAVSGTTVSYAGAADWGYRRMVLHYAHLCAAAGGVETFLIGSELRGLTTVRSAAGTFPAVTALVDLAGEARSVLGSTTDEGEPVAISYAADWSEYFGYQPDDGSGDVYFHLDPLWADAEIDFVGIDNYFPIADWRDGDDHLDAADWPSIRDRGYLAANIEGGEGYDWYYADATDRADQVRTTISDGAYAEPWVFRFKDLRNWWGEAHHNRPGGVRSGTATAWVPEGKPIRFVEFGCPAVDRGANQPNVFVDPKSGESALPYFSRGWRDDAMQRAALEAVLAYWGDDALNPASGVYSGRMIDLGNCAAWAWDARPYPWFPALADVWGDAGNWRLGHWLTGRIGSGGLAGLVRQLAAGSGLDAALIDATDLAGAVEGHVLTAIESPRASISVLARHFGFDAVESEGQIRFVMRGRAPAAVLTPDDLVDVSMDGSLFELERAQETELPAVLKWTVTRADGEYEPKPVEARRQAVGSVTISAESFPCSVAPEEAERRCRRALQEAWVGREAATLTLPPSRLALDPGDVLALTHDGRDYELRLTVLSDGEARGVSAVMQDRDVYDLPPGAATEGAVSSAVVFGTARVEFLDLPQLSEDVSAWYPALAAWARPWPGSVAVYRSASDDGFELQTSFVDRAEFGVTLTDLDAGPASRIDHANVLDIELVSGELASVTDTQLFAGANALALQSGTGWEILQAGEVELIGPGQYRLSRLLRGQRGTEAFIAGTLATGTTVVLLDSVAFLPVTRSDVWLPWNFRIGPSALPYTDDAYLDATFTPKARGLRPFSPCQVAQPWRRPRSPGDLTISWVRRSRDLAADSWEASEVPLGEESEAYEVDVMDGATVLRTLTATTPSVVYTAADQTTDWGAPLDQGDSLTVKIMQTSVLYGRGAAITTILEF